MGKVSEINFKVRFTVKLWSRVEVIINPDLNTAWIPPYFDRFGRVLKALLSSIG